MYLPQQASNQKQNLEPLEDVIRLKPADNLLNVGPYPPAHGKGDNKPQQLDAIGLLGSMVAVDGNDADCTGVSIRTSVRPSTGSPEHLP